MRKKNKLDRNLIHLVITISLYVVFFDSIESKPNHVGFWFILAMGISIGVAICRFVYHYRETKNNTN